MSWLLHIRKALAFMAVGLLLGIGLLIVLYTLPHEPWKQIISPPEKPVRFLGQSAFTFWGGSIYIESENGNIFSYTCDSENPCIWVKEDAPPSVPEKNLWSCPSNYTWSAITPLILFKKVVDSYKVNICGVDYTNQINLVLLDDSTIWVWNSFSAATDSDFIFIPVWLLTSAVAGFATYIALLIRKKKDQVQDVETHV